VVTLHLTSPQKCMRNRNQSIMYNEMRRCKGLKNVGSILRISKSVKAVESIHVS
jgi:hypothetical protein